MMARRIMNDHQDLLFHHFRKNDDLILWEEKYENPPYIQDNLKDNLRKYQDEALRYLHYAQKSKECRHLLFNMATGAGKTMVMAGAILYLFKEYGYQNFLFFVHSDAIIEKTKDNLLNSQSTKYLFNLPLEINGQKIYIEAVDTFPALVNTNTIYIKLSSIQKIHDGLNSGKENDITYEDLKDVNLVLLGDEAHHFNAATKLKNKKLTSKEAQEKAWEVTIQKILRLNPKNRLLEFTATIDLNDNELYEKYKNKIIYQYDLKAFMHNGFSKKVMLLEANQEDHDKILDAVLLSQYRKLLAKKNDIHSFKPIILFKSNTIEVSKNTHVKFSQIIKELTPNKIELYIKQKINYLRSSTSIWHKVIEYYCTLDLLSIVEDIKKDFNEHNLFNANNEELIKEQPILLNTLENINNPIRAIFAVAKLNEGWDVLNLYDIVRISENATSTKKNTNSEAQLIGRGARYYPFIYEGKSSYIRRFDHKDTDLRILEQLHYHTINDPAYIQLLHTSLDQANIVVHQDGGGVVKDVKLKTSFTNSEIYKNAKLFYNLSQQQEDESRSWKSYALDTVFEETYQIIDEQSLDNLSEVTAVNDKLERLNLYIDRQYFLKAIAKERFYQFDNLQKYFPKLKSINEFITSEEYLAGVKINIKIPSTVTLRDLSAKDKMQLLQNVLLKISNAIRKNYYKNEGTYDFVGKPIKDFIKDYRVYIDPPLNIYDPIISDKEMNGKKWYVFDIAVLNQLEHRLVSIIEPIIRDLESIYSSIYLIRNDENSTGFKLTEFNGVRGFMPDFLLIMRNKQTNDYYQVFIEVKGEQLVSSDQWKEHMLEKINHTDLVVIKEDLHVRLVGIKFFIGQNHDEFENDIKNKLLQN